MKLLTKSIRDRLVKNHQQTEQSGGTIEHKVVVKLFNPTGIGTWYLTELNPDNNVAFGLCVLHEKELGAVSLDELANFKGMFGLGIERDKLFKSNSKTLEECYNG